MNHCRDGKHFDGFVRDRPGWALCDLTINISDDGPKHPQTLAISIDTNDYFGILQVSPDFGCVQFEARA